MHRLLAAALTCVVAAGLAIGAGFGIVAALNATPEQPNVPLVHFHSSPDEIPGLDESTLPSASPSGSASPSNSAAERPDAHRPHGSDAADDGSTASPKAPSDSLDDAPSDSSDDAPGNASDSSSRGDSRSAVKPSAPAAVPGE